MHYLPIAPRMPQMKKYRPVAANSRLMVQRSFRRASTDMAETAIEI